MATTRNNPRYDCVDTTEYSDHSSDKDMIEYSNCKDSDCHIGPKKEWTWSVCSLVAILILVTLSVFGAAALAVISYSEIRSLKLPSHHSLSIGE